MPAGGWVCRRPYGEILVWPNPRLGAGELLEAARGTDLRHAIDLLWHEAAGPVAGSFSDGKFFDFPNLRAAKTCCDGQETRVPVSLYTICATGTRVSCHLTPICLHRHSETRKTCHRNPVRLHDATGAPISRHRQVRSSAKKDTHIAVIFAHSSFDLWFLFVPY